MLQCVHTTASKRFRFIKRFIPLLTTHRKANIFLAEQPDEHKNPDLMPVKWTQYTFLWWLFSCCAPGKNQCNESIHKTAVFAILRKALCSQSPGPPALLHLVLCLAQGRQEIPELRGESQPLNTTWRTRLGHSATTLKQQIYVGCEAWKEF